jgi:Ca2+-binding EF-hand superfamily protein
MLCTICASYHLSSFSPTTISPITTGLNKGTNLDPSSLQEAALKRCFSMFDSDSDGKLTEDDLDRVTACMGFDFISAADLLSKYDSGPAGFTYDVFKNMVRDLANQFKKQEGRYYVLLSLDEAEHFRGVIHGRKGFPLLPSEASSALTTGGAAIGGKTTAALWVLADNTAFMLGASKDFAQAPPAQHSAMVNSFRYMNSEVYFDDNSLTVLLRVLEGNSCEEREKWWTDVRACRRRRQIACDASMPVVTVFNTTTEFQFMEFKAVVDRVQWALRERGLLVFDAFRAFNSSNSGLMTCSELYGGLDFLGIPFTPDQVYDLVRKVAIQNEVSAVSNDALLDQRGGDGLDLILCITRHLLLFLSPAFLLDQQTCCRCDNLFPDLMSLVFLSVYSRVSSHTGSSGECSRPRRRTWRAEEEAPRTHSSSSRPSRSQSSQSSSR